MSQYKNKASKKKFRWTIAKKISGLATVLIIFILIIISYSIFALKSIQADLNEIANLDIPLTEIANSIEIHQLEKQIIFDELLRIALPNSNFESAKKDEIEQKLLEDNVKLNKDITRGLLLIEANLDSSYKAKFIPISESFITLQQESNSLNNITLEIINIINQNNYPNPEIIDSLLVKDEQFNRNAMALIDSIQNFTQRRLVMAQHHEKMFLVVNSSLGIAAIFLGILLSLIIIINIKTNLFQVSQKISQVREAIANKQSILPHTTDINASDEIGDLAVELSKTIADFSQEISERERLSENLKAIATTDRLTGAFNRLKWDEVLTSEIAKTQQKQQNLSVIMFDIDFFKKVNDTYGHDVGDMVLIEVVKVAKQHIRNTDSLYRIGGEEFVILAPDTDRSQVLSLAERVRKAMEEHMFREVERITISMGVTQFQESDDAGHFVKRADLALYQSKKGGRNQVNSY